MSEKELAKRIAELEEENKQLKSDRDRWMKLCMDGERARNQVMLELLGLKNIDPTPVKENC